MLKRIVPFVLLLAVFSGVAQAQLPGFINNRYPLQWDLLGHFPGCPAGRDCYTVSGEVTNWGDSLLPAGHTFLALGVVFHDDSHQLVDFKPLEHALAPNGGYIKFLFVLDDPSIYTKVKFYRVILVRDKNQKIRNADLEIIGVVTLDGRRYY